MEQNMNVEESIRIGFLDGDRENQLEDYKKHFDIVIVGEGDFELTNYLIKHISGLQHEIDMKFESIIFWYLWFHFEIMLTISFFYNYFY